MSKPYMHVYVNTDENALFGSEGPGEHDADLSRKSYVNMVEGAVVEAFPDHDVDVVEAPHTRYIDGDFETSGDFDDAATAERIVNDVYGSFEWLVNE